MAFFRREKKTEILRCAFIHDILIKNCNKTNILYFRKAIFDQKKFLAIQILKLYIFGLKIIFIANCKISLLAEKKTFIFAVFV